MITFEKILSANDTGESGSHQAGILVPKSVPELLDFLPKLADGIKNPDTLLDCCDKDGTWWRWRFIYYNNKFYDIKGTRNEYRITRMTRYLKLFGAKAGDRLQFTQRKDGGYNIVLIKSTIRKSNQTIKLAGWRRVH